MTSKLKCPFCQQELHKDPDGYYSCYTDNCSIMSAGGNGASGTESLWAALIQSQQDLEESQQATIQNAQTVLEIHKDLEIATKALDDISSHYQDEMGKPTFVDWYLSAKKMCDFADKALEQITHDSSEKANNLEHKDEK